MNWDDELEEFKTYLKLERGLTPNSVKAYANDISKLIEFLNQDDNADVTPDKVTPSQFRSFINWLAQEKSISARTQARILSGIRSFYKNLILNEKIDEDPTETVQAPKIGRKLPTVLSVDEIDAIEAAFDTSKMDGARNLAIVETLYSCGLRVSELTGMKMSDLHFDQGYVTVFGKGQKERLVPIGKKAQSLIQDYVTSFRNDMTIQPGHEAFLFLNKNGHSLSRVMVFKMLKDAATAAGVTKVISPHTLRHSFATHLVDGGANLRAVQEMLFFNDTATTEIYTHLDNNYLKSTLVEHHPYKKND